MQIDNELLELGKRIKELNIKKQKLQGNGIKRKLPSNDSNRNSEKKVKYDLIIVQESNQEISNKENTKQVEKQLVNLIIEQIEMNSII